MRTAASARHSSGKVCQTSCCIRSLRRIAVVLPHPGWVPGPVSPAGGRPATAGGPRPEGRPAAPLGALRPALRHDGGRMDLCFDVAIALPYSEVAVVLDDGPLAWLPEVGLAPAGAHTA